MSAATLPLLSSKQLAAFVADGFLRFDALLPDALARELLADVAAGKLAADATGGPHSGAPLPRAGMRLEAAFGEQQVLGRVLRFPPLAGIIASLVGPSPIYDHHHAHVIAARQAWSQPWHADAILDARMAFDIQLFFFLHDTPREMGGTMLLPGSHLRRINESDVARYQNFRGQLATVCSAGTVVVCHHGIWHCGQPNLTDRSRTMFKLRLNPSVRQLRLWNTADVDDPSIAEILTRDHQWYGSEVRLEIVKRIKLWRHVTGNARFDVGHWLTRLENEP